MNDEIQMTKVVDRDFDLEERTAMFQSVAETVQMEDIMLTHFSTLSPADTLEDEVEPFLLRCGLLQRTPRGRMATAKTFAHLKLPMPEADDEAGQGRLF